MRALIVGLTGCAVMLCTMHEAVAQSTAQPDRAYSLVGRWLCRSAAGSDGVLTYTQETGGSISMVNTFRAPGGALSGFRESYRFDAVTNSWKWTSIQFGQASAESGVAAPWSLASWTFQGTNADRTPIRMTYLSIDDNTIERHFDSKQDGVWMTYSDSTCRRFANDGSLAPSRPPSP